MLLWDEWKRFMLFYGEEQISLAQMTEDRLQMITSHYNLHFEIQHNGTFKRARAISPFTWGDQDTHSHRQEYVAYLSQHLEIPDPPRSGMF